MLKGWKVYLQIILHTLDLTLQISEKEHRITPPLKPTLFRSFKTYIPAEGASPQVSEELFHTTIFVCLYVVFICLVSLV